MTSKEYQKFKIILSANEEDRSLGLEALKNSEPTLIQLMLLGKYLNNRERFEFTTKFPDVKKYLVSWNELFPMISKLKPNSKEKELIEEEFNHSLIKMIKDHHEFIDEIKIKLTW